MPDPREMPHFAGRLNVDKALEETPERRRMLAEMQQVIRESTDEIDDNPVPADDEEHFTDPQEMPNPRKPTMRVQPRGPIASRQNNERIKRVEEEQRARGLDFGPAIEDGIDVEDVNLDDEEEGEGEPLTIEEVRRARMNNGRGDLPPPRERPHRASTISNDVISNDVINNSDVAPKRNAPPAPTELQLLKAQIAKLTAQVNDLKKGKETRDHQDSFASPTRLVGTVQKDPSYERVDLVSNAIFYKEFTADDIRARKINVPVQMAITIAKTTGDLVKFNDALNATLPENVDIRDFSTPDYFYFLYWHKFNSYTKIPLNVTWRSKYGNENVYSIVKDSLKYKTPAITQEEYNEFYERGLVVPTVRDYELFQTSELTEDERTVIQTAQYFRPYPDGEKTLAAKVAGMQYYGGSDIELLQEIPRFRELTNHGVINEIQLADSLFNPREYIAQLREQADIIREEAESNKQAMLASNPAEYDEYQDTIKELLKEAETMEAILEEGGQVEPDLETVSLQISPLDFFPAL